MSDPDTALVEKHERTDLPKKTERQPHRFRKMIEFAWLRLY